MCTLPPLNDRVEVVDGGGNRAILKRTKRKRTLFNGYSLTHTTPIHDHPLIPTHTKLGMTQE